MEALRQHKYYLLGTAALLWWLVPNIVWGFDAFDDFIVPTLYVMVVNITGLALWLGALFLDFGINTFVIGFGEFFTRSVGVAVDSVWVTIRDFLNLFFVFGLVYIGFKMILNSDDSNTRRWLVQLILAALLINFSLFITKFVVDITNQLATEIAVAGFKEGEANEFGAYNVDMAGDLMNRLDISGAWDWEGNFDSGRGMTVGYVVGTGAMFLVAAFVFAAAGIMLMIRFVVLCFFLVLSPVMFIGWILPPLGNTMAKYWELFLKKAFFAPIFFLFMYLSLQVISTMQQAKVLQSTSSGTGGSATINYDAADLKNAQGVEDASLVPFFLVAIFFMVASLWAANKLGADGAGQAVKLGRVASRKAGGAVAGIPMRGVQYGASKVQQGYERVDARMSRSRTGRIARSALSVGTLGLASDKGIQSTLGKVQEARILGSETYEESKKRNRELTNRRNGLVQESETRKDIRQSVVRDEDGNVLTLNSSSTAEEIEQFINARRKKQTAIQDMSAEELLNQIEASPGNRKAFIEPDIAGMLTDSQVETLEKSGLYRADEIKTLRDNRNEGALRDIETVLNNSNATEANLSEIMDELNKTLSKMSDERLQKAGKDFLQKEPVAAQMSGAQMKTLKESGRLTIQDFKDVGKARKEAQKKIIEEGSLANPASPGAKDSGFQEKQRRRLFKNAEEAAQMDIDVLAHKDAQQYMTPKIVDKFLENNPNTKAVDKLRTAIETHLYTDASSGQTKSFETWTEKQVTGRQFGLDITKKNSE